MTVNSYLVGVTVFANFEVRDKTITFNCLLNQNVVFTVLCLQPCQSGGPDPPAIR